MRAGRSYYEILGVTHDATAADIRSAYRRLLRTCHPDVGGSAALFDLVNEAFTVLSDTVQRAAYTAGEGLRAAAAAAPRTASGTTGTGPATVTGRDQGTSRRAHDGDDYAALRRAQSPMWRPQAHAAYAAASAPTRQLERLYL